MPRSIRAPGSVTGGVPADGQPSGERVVGKALAAGTSVASTPGGSRGRTGTKEDTMSRWWLVGAAVLATAAMALPASADPHDTWRDRAQARSRDWRGDRTY